MTEIINCPACTRTVSVPERLIGKTVRCPSCKSTFVAESAIGEVEVVEEEPPRAAEVAAKDPAPRPHRGEDEYDEEERPTFRDLNVHGWERVRIGLILVVAGFVVALIS